MRAISPELAAHFEGGATTLCHCWAVTRQDGVCQGFTDHDENLSFEGMDFLASSGLEGSEAENALGFSIGSGEISGALSSPHIAEADILMGRYDGAEVHLWLVNWANPAMRLLKDKATIGEIKRAEFGFTAELRGAMVALDAEQGRVYQAGCNANVGDTRCGVALNTPAFQAQVSISETDGRLAIKADGLRAFADGWFTGGVVEILSGVNAGTKLMVKAHSAGGALLLWQALPQPIAVGDVIKVGAGCDRRFETCRVKFANTINFRGFPHIPTPDYVMGYARPGESVYDGGKLIR